MVQQHFNGTVFFNQTWAQFKAGFGNVTGDYWIGNDRLHSLTTYGGYRLRVDIQLKSDLSWQWSEYDTFIVGDESTGYALQVGGFSGTANNGFLGDTGTVSDPNNLNGMKFTSIDRDNDNYQSGSCAKDYLAGFWYNNCGSIFINSYGISFEWQWGAGALKISRMTLIPR